jgi:hypothetical protein
MSGFTQYVIADKKEKKQVADHGYPIEKWRGCDGFKFFAADGLGHLYWIIKNGEGSYKDFPLTTMGEYGWIHDIPEDMVSYLAAIDEKDLPDLANAWSERIAEREALGHYKPAELLTLLQDLKKLAIEAVAASKPIFLWHSLSC